MAQPTTIPYLAVLDFEATCDNRKETGWDPKKSEIIEFPVALICTKLNQVVDTFQRLVRPTVQPILPPFCTELTSITQTQLAEEATIDCVFNDFLAWLRKHQLHENNCYFVTCGDWDLRKMWPLQTALCNSLHTPNLFKQWINIKTTFHQTIGTKPRGMMDLLMLSGLPHIGRHHRGIDDVINTSNVAMWLLKKKASFRLTWDDSCRRKEHKIYQRKVLKKQRTICHLQNTIKQRTKKGSNNLSQKAHLLKVLEEELYILQRKELAFS